MKSKGKKDENKRLPMQWSDDASGMNGICEGPLDSDRDINQSFDTLDKQIEDLDLSVRSYNCLKRAGIHSVRQLVEYSENDLLNIRNFGAKSIEEVKDKLISMDLNLKQ